MECPVCGSANVTASHRRGIEKLFRYLLPRAPYRCKDCWSRFWRTENPFKTTVSKLGALAVLLLLAAVVSLPFWGAESDGPKNPAETAEESHTLPVPTHRSAQRTYDGDAVRSSAPPRSRSDDPGDSVPPTFVRARPPDLAGDSETDAASPSLTPMAGPPSTTEPSSETSTGEVPPIAAAPTESAEASATSASEVSGVSGVSEPGATDASEAGERVPAARPESESPADVEAPEPAAPETVASTAADPAEPGPAEAVETAAVSPETEESSPATGELPPSPSGPRTLTGLMSRSGDGRFELTAVAGGPVRKTNVFPLSDPPKLVVDLAGEWDRKVTSPVAVESPLVKRVRLGNHPDFLRLVLDLADAGPVGHEIVPTAEGFRLRLFPEGGS